MIEDDRNHGRYPQLDPKQTTEPIACGFGLLSGSVHIHSFAPRRVQQALEPSLVTIRL